MVRVKKFCAAVLKIYRKALKVNIQNKVALRQVVRKQFNSFQDRSLMTLLKINLSYLKFLY